jgi:hypothetical protein
MGICALYVHLEDGPNEGELAFKTKKVKDATGYLVIYTDDPSLPREQWAKMTTTKTKGLITGLTSGTRYTVRMAGTNATADAEQHSDYSDPVQRTVQ